jgi:hypothetical protein
LLPTISRACGWQANIEGDFSQVEADECLGAVSALQRLYALELKIISQREIARQTDRTARIVLMT